MTKKDKEKYPYGLPCSDDMVAAYEVLFKNSGDLHITSMDPEIIDELSKKYDLKSGPCGVDIKNADAKTFRNIKADIQGTLKNKGYKTETPISFPNGKIITAIIVVSLIAIIVLIRKCII